jgi:(2Fe-2S) ferredoxin
MPPPYKKHVFVCLHEREKDDPKGDCLSKGSDGVLKKMKKALKARGLSGEIRANKSGCLDNCEQGCSIVVYPEAVWYGHVQESDVDEIIEKHLIGNEPVTRLKVR